jgi:hypothetical protein
MTLSITIKNGTLSTRPLSITIKTGTLSIMPLSMTALDTAILSVTNKPIMLSVVMLNVVMLSVVSLN